MDQSHTRAGPRLITVTIISSVSLIQMRTYPVLILEEFRAALAATAVLHSIMLGQSNQIKAAACPIHY